MSFKPPVPPKQRTTTTTTTGNYKKKSNEPSLASLFLSTIVSLLLLGAVMWLGWNGGIQEVIKACGGYALEISYGEGVCIAFLVQSLTNLLGGESN